MVFSESGASSVVATVVMMGKKRTGLSLASDLVAGAGDGLLGLVEGGLGGVGSLASVSEKVRKLLRGNVRASPQPWCGNPCELLQTWWMLLGIWFGWLIVECKL